jgi:hypothetical protein
MYGFSAVLFALSARAVLFSIPSLRTAGSHETIREAWPKIAVLCGTWIAVYSGIECSQKQLRKVEVPTTT